MRLTLGQLDDIRRSLVDGFQSPPEPNGWYRVAHNTGEGWAFGWEREEDGEHVDVEWWPEGFETLHPLDLEAVGVVVQ